MKLLSRIALLLTVLTFASNASAAARAQHVFIISIDGGKPAVIEQSQMPTLKTLVSEGAHTWVANTTVPSTTLPSHTSMLTGVGPDQHKVLWNNWNPTNVLQVPTVFSEAKKKGLSTAMFVGKEKFRHFALSNTVDEFVYNRAASRITEKAEEGEKKIMKEGTVMAKAVAKDAAKYIVKEKPNLCFLHFADPDSAGHKFGWGSSEQKEAFANVDKALAVIMEAIRKAGIADQSVIIISADHGGHKKGHGTKDPEDMNIPWVVWGKNVKPGFTITEPVTTYDTAATAIWLLDQPIPASFKGSPRTSAFN